MGVERIPERKIFTCDGCGKKHESEKPQHVSWSKPPQWTTLNWQRDAHDFQGNAVADASIHLLLCPFCSTLLGETINKAFAGYRSMKEEGDSV